MISNKKNAKMQSKYNCKLCDYTTCRKSNYNDHILSAKHQSSMISNENLQIVNENLQIYNENDCIISSNEHFCTPIMQTTGENAENQQKISKLAATISNNFYCEMCKYKTNRKSSYESHLLTKKHYNLNVCNNNTKTNYQCEICNNHYKDYSGLWRHKKKCVIPTNELIEEIPKLDYINPKLDYTNDIVGKLIQENQSLRNFVIEQNQEMMKLMTNQNNTISDISKLISTSIPTSTTTNNIINNNNNKFNINLFLNEKCKDAMNFTDFIENIEVSHADLENNAQLGFVNGISKIIIDNLKQLSVYNRPIHCSDVKRETMYIKNDDKWTNEEDTKKLTTAIQLVSKKSMITLVKWQETNPDFQDMDSEFSTKCIEMTQQSIAGNNREVYYPKVIRALAKETMINKANSDM